MTSPPSLSGLETTFGLDILNSINANESYVFSPITLLFTLAILGPKEFNSTTVAQKYSEYGLKDPDVYKYLKRDLEHIVVRGDAGMITSKINTSDESRIMFNQAWESKLPQAQIRSGNFYHLSNNSRKVIYYKSEGKFLYSEDDVFKTISIAYDSWNLYFVAMLPKENFGLQEALKKLKKIRFEKLLCDATPELVHLTLPKFNIIQLLINSKQLGLQPPIKTIMSYKLYPRVAGIMHRPDNRDPYIFRADRPFIFSVLRKNRPVYFGVYS